MNKLTVLTMFGFISSVGLHLQLQINSINSSVVNKYQSTETKDQSYLGVPSIPVESLNYFADAVYRSEVNAHESTHNEGFQRKSVSIYPLDHYISPDNIAPVFDNAEPREHGISLSPDDALGFAENYVPRSIGKSISPDNLQQYIDANFEQGDLEPILSSDSL